MVDTTTTTTTKSKAKKGKSNKMYWALLIVLFVALAGVNVYYMKKNKEQKKALEDAQAKLNQQGSNKESIESAVEDVAAEPEKIKG